jgi:Ran GTPase-activating protein (RanGAP) involved in mRNA processing and transport
MIDNEGCKFIALSLMVNKHTSIKNLNLKLNRITDKGGTRFFQQALSIKSLEILNFAANAIGKTTAM